MHKHYVRSATLTFKLVNGTLISTIKYETKLFSTECMHKILRAQCDFELQVVNGTCTRFLHTTHCLDMISIYAINFEISLQDKSMSWT